MVRVHQVALACLLAGLATVAASETVYKWVDSSGQVHFTDVPPRQGDARILSVYQQESGFAEEEEGEGDDFTEEGDDAGSTPSAPRGEPTTPEPEVSDEMVKAAEADAAKAKVERCKAAQDRYQRYTESRRLFRETPDGKREYLTDKELTEARGRAKQAVSDFCS